MDMGGAIWVFTGSVIGGIKRLLVKSDEERRFKAYQRAREGIGF